MTVADVQQGPVYFKLFPLVFCAVNYSEKIVLIRFYSVWKKREKQTP
jgi:hypothetical protein